MIKDSKYFFILLVALFSVSMYFHAVAKEMVFSPFSDFGNYWLNASIIKEGLNPWSQDEQTQAQRDKLVRQYNFLVPGPAINSLGFMSFMQLFTLFDFRLAALLWVILGHIVLLYSLWLMLRIARGKPSSEVIFFVLFLVFSFWPIRETLHDGQVCFLTLFFIAASIYFMKGEKWLLAGILLSIAIQTKEYLAISLLAFVWKRNWRILAGVVLGVFLVKMSEILMFGWGLELAYWKYMFSFGTHIYPSVNNHTLISVIFRIGEGLMGASFCKLLSLILIIILTCLAMFWTRKTADVLLGLFPFLILSFIVTPWIHESHYIILYPAIITIWFCIGERKQLTYYLLFILAYLLLGLRYSLNSFPLFHSGILALFTTGKLAGMIILFILAGRLARESGSKNLYAP